MNAIPRLALGLLATLLGHSTPAAPPPAAPAPPAPPAPHEPPPVRVFILAGQSNMEGPAVVDLSGTDYNQGKGTLRSLLEDPRTRPLVEPLLEHDADRDADPHADHDADHHADHHGTTPIAWRVRDDVRVWYKPERGNGRGAVRSGPLTVGFTPHSDAHHFGPELQFGMVVGDAIDAPVLLIKTAWGGKSLRTDFRPPSSGGDTGKYYKLMLENIALALPPSLADLRAGDEPSKVPAYEIAGLVWYQGWNDGCDPEHAVPEYEQNLVNLIKDLRKDLGVANLPVVVAELTGPWKEAPGAWDTLRKAQAAAAARPEFKGNVVFVPTHDFVRAPEDSPNPGHGHHEFGNAETYLLVGDAMGRAMLGLIGVGEKQTPSPTTATPPTPPTPKRE